MRYRSHGVAGLKTGRARWATPSNRENERGAGASAELRILRPGPAASGHRGADLHLRMHVLRGLRRDQAVQRLPELRRRLCAAADPPGRGMASRPLRRQASRLGQARSPVAQPARDRRPVGTAAEYSTARPLTRSFQRRALLQGNDVDIAAPCAHEGSRADGGHSRNEIGAFHGGPAFRASRPLGRWKFRVQHGEPRKRGQRRNLKLVSGRMLQIAYSAGFDGTIGRVGRGRPTRHGRASHRLRR